MPISPKSGNIWPKFRQLYFVSNDAYIGFLCGFTVPARRPQTSCYLWNTRTLFFLLRKTALRRFKNRSHLSFKLANIKLRLSWPIISNSRKNFLTSSQLRRSFPQPLQRKKKNWINSGLSPMASYKTMSVANSSTIFPKNERSSASHIFSIPCDSAEHSLFFPFLKCV